MDKKQFVQNIIKNNLYLSLSTCDGKKPWIATVQYVVDDNHNFYFISAIDSLHGQHILKNSNVAFSIFDSHQPSGTGEGIQVMGKASLIQKVDYPDAIVRYFDELKGIPINLDKYAVFKIEPVKFFVPDTVAWEKEGVDKRAEVKIK